jgi:Iron/manganese superoxide dismutases, C-terminal domain
MRPGGGGPPDGDVGRAIRRCFGSYDHFAREFMSASASCHGNGWIWLTAQDRDVRIVLTTNSDSPLLAGQVTLLGLDLWEHAFYLDHQNRRADYVRSFLDDLVNWDFANENLYITQPGTEHTLIHPLPRHHPAPRDIEVVHSRIRRSYDYMRITLDECLAGASSLVAVHAA